MAKKTNKEQKLFVTLTRSPITAKKGHKATLKALGLRKMHQTVEHTDNPSIRGMIAKVDFMVTVEEGEAAS